MFPKPIQKSPGWARLFYKVMLPLALLLWLLFRHLALVLPQARRAAATFVGAAAVAGTVGASALLIAP